MPLDKITFGVCYGGETQYSQLNSIIHSIINQHEDQIPDWELIVIGKKPDDWQCVYPNDAHRIKFNDFNEPLRDKPWITKKKNIITQMASFENIVYFHDYFRLDPMWYHHWKRSQLDFEVAINKVYIQEPANWTVAYRSADWLVNPYDLWKLHPELNWKCWDVALPYKYKNLGKIQYISGGWWMAKRRFMLDNPLNETLTWGDSEDCRWSEVVREKTQFVLNDHAAVWILKPDKWKPNEISNYHLEGLCKAHGLELK